VVASGTEGAAALGTEYMMRLQLSHWMI
jgi:hypothetical protein